MPFTELLLWCGLWFMSAVIGALLGILSESVRQNRNRVDDPDEGPPRRQR